MLFVLVVLVVDVLLSSSCTADTSARERAVTYETTITTTILISILIMVGQMLLFFAVLFGVAGFVIYDVSKNIDNN